MTLFSSSPFVIDFNVRSAPNNSKPKQWKVNTLHGQWIEWLKTQKTSYKIISFYTFIPSFCHSKVVLCSHLCTFIDALSCIAFVFAIRVEGLILSFLQHLLLAPILKVLSTQHSFKYMQGQDCWQYIIVILLLKCSFLFFFYSFQVPSM